VRRAESSEQAFKEQAKRIAVADQRVGPVGMPQKGQLQILEADCHNRRRWRDLDICDLLL
jgi:hypothetical protein